MRRHAIAFAASNRTLRQKQRTPYKIRYLVNFMLLNTKSPYFEVHKSDVFGKNNAF